MITTALKMAWCRRDHTEHSLGAVLIHSAIPGGQGTSIAFAQTLVLEGLAASIGSVADPCDKAWRTRTGCSGPKPLAEEPGSQRPVAHPRRCRIRDDGMFA